MPRNAKPKPKKVQRSERGNISEYVSFKMPPGTSERTNLPLANQVLSRIVLDPDPALVGIEKLVRDKVESVRLAYIESNGTPGQLEQALNSKAQRSIDLCKGIDFRDVRLYELAVMQELTRVNNLKPVGTRDIAKEVMQLRGKGKPNI